MKTQMFAAASGAAGRIRPAFVSDCYGREPELRQLDELSRVAVTEQRSQVAVVTGPAGIGKSRLVEELARRQRSVGMVTYEGSARYGDPPYGCVAELVDAVVIGLRAEGNAPFSLISDGLDLAAALRLQAPRVEAPRALSRMAVFEQTRSFLVAAGSMHCLGVIFTLHDLHLADDATRALVAHLARMLAPEPELPCEGSFSGLLLLTGRELDPALTAQTACTRIALGPLGREAIRDYLSSTAVVDRMMHASGGVPGGVETLVGLCPPPGQLVRALTEGQSAPVAWLVRALALLGRPAPLDLVLRLLAEQGVGREVLEQLCACPLIRRRAAPSGVEIGFARETDRESVLAAVAFPERRELHLAIGRALASGGAALDDEATAEHLLLGGAAHEGTKRALEAVSRLHVHFAYERALALLRLVGEYGAAGPSKDAVASAVARLTARTAELAGDYATALSAVDDQLSRLLPGDQQRAAVVTNKGRLHLLRGELAQATEALAEGCDSATKAGDESLVAEGHAAFAEVKLLDGDHSGATFHAMEALTTPGLSARVVVARLAARNILGRVHLEQVSYGEAARHFSVAAIEARAHSLPNEAARALLNLGIATLRAGRYAAAQEHYQDALELAEQAVDLRQRAFCMQNLGVLAQWRRDYRVAFERYHEAVRSFERLGHRPWLAWVVIDLGDLYLDMGDVAHAIHMAQAAERLLGPGSPVTAEVILTHFRARVAYHKGELAESERLLERAERLAEETGARDERDLVRVYRARLLGERGEIDRACELLDELADSKAPRLAAQRDAARAYALWRGGRFEEAATMARIAELAWKELGDDEGRLEALIVQAEAARVRGDEVAAFHLEGLARGVDASLRERVPAQHADTYGRDPVRQRFFAARSVFGGSGGEA